MFASIQSSMLLAGSAISTFIAAEAAGKATSDFAAAIRECILTLGVFGAFVFLCRLRQRATKKATKRFDKLGYECPTPQRAAPSVERIRKPKEIMENTRLNQQAPNIRRPEHTRLTESPAAEVSRMVTEHTRLTELLHSLAKEGDHHKASMAMKMLEEKYGTPGVPEYTALITMCSKANDVDGVRMWIKRLQDRGHARNHVCFNALINVHSKLGEISKAVAVVGEMRDAGVECDVVTYNTIIDACARKADAANAQVWMKKMLAAGVSPSVVSFCSVMRACAKAALNDDLEYWIEQADALGIQLNMICFSAVINAFAQNGDLTSAEYWLTRMAKCNVNPSTHCFTGILEAACKNGDVEQAAKIVDRMREAHVVPDDRMVMMLVKLACQTRDLERAQTWINESAGELNARKIETLLSTQGVPAWFAAKLKIPSGVDSDKIVPNKVVTEEPADRGIKSAEGADLVGKRLVGMIKEFVTGKFGYITCDEAYAIFKRDIFLSDDDNPKQLAKGQKVSFVLQIDVRRGLPRACDVKVFQK